jgi:hypothetical protein
MKMMMGIVHQPTQQQLQLPLQPLNQRLQNTIHQLIWDNIVVLVGIIVVVYTSKNTANEITVSHKNITDEN